MASSAIFMICFVLFSVAGAINLPDHTPPPRCWKPHQHFDSCGSACPPTCKNPKPGPCILSCVSGCFCDRDFVLDGHGNCIRKEHCPVIHTTTTTRAPCGWNEEYVPCPNPCPPTCQRPHPPLCTAMCSPFGCQCKDGYVKDHRGICIRREHCPVFHTTTTRAPCGWNEEYVRCPNPCPPTCQRPHPPLCTAMCRPFGCQCKDGYVKDDRGICIKPDDCPGSQCKKNERWTDDCVPPPRCQHPRCPTDSNFKCPPSCTKGGCICEEGYLRDRNGNCIPRDQCDGHHPADGGVAGPGGDEEE